MGDRILETTHAALARLGNDPWNAFTHVEAREGSAEGPLRGLVVSIKDNLAVRGMPMTCGSKHLEDYVAPYDATIVTRLLEAGATILGKTNMDEFAAGSSGENSAFGPTLNPVDATRVPGGSSSGAGASVASGACDAAIGTDTGGSIRSPASFCGLAALKPSRGVVSRFGMADLAMSLESPAPAARDVETLARVMRVIAGPEPRDALTKPPSDWTLQELDRLTVGVPREAFEGLAPDVEAPIRSALHRLEAHGVELRDVALPSLAQALASYYVINYAEFASAMQRLDGIRYGASRPSIEQARALFGPETKRRILLGTFVTSREEKRAWYDAALCARDEVARDFHRALAQCDVMMAPTMPVRAFKLGERIADPRQMYAADILTVPANLAGTPAGSVPLRVDGLPVGLQIIGREGDDARVLSAMRLAERVVGVGA